MRARLALGLGVLALLIVVPGATAESAPEDFAYGLTVEPAGDRPVQRVLLPRRVYRSGVRPDLGDLRVFNGDGEVVPHALLRPDEPTRPDERSVPFFLLKDPTSPEELSVVWRSGSTRVEVQGSSAENMPLGYLGLVVDAASVDRPVDRVRLEFRQGSEVDARDLWLDVAVETSDDLTHWSPWGRRTTLARLRQDGKTLERDEIERPPRRFRYLRLSWVRSVPAPAVGGVWLSPVGPGTAERRWARLDGTSPEAHVYLYDQDGVLPVDRVRLDLPEANTLARVVVSSAPTLDGPWRRRASGWVYRLRDGSRELQAPALEVARVTDRYWKVEVDPRGGGVGRRPPALELGWRPESLLFVPRGPGPYLLAFGSAVARPAALEPGALLGPVGDEGVDGLSVATLGKEIRELGGARRLEDPWEPPWRRILLWAVLVASVLGLGRMVVGLLREVGEA